MIAPLYLLADSQLLFWRSDENSLTAEIRANLPTSDPKGAYIGASNGELAEFYELFVAAMESLGISNCRSIPARPENEDRAFLEEADLVLLAGGDVEKGWSAFERYGLKDMILSKRYDGSVLVGVSAGAVQLGLGALTESPQPKKLDLFGFAPFYIGAHEENEDWWNLRALVNLDGAGVRGVGIPMGGGAIYRPDGTLEPIRQPLIELVKEENRIGENLIMPARASAGI